MPRPSPRRLVFLLCIVVALPTFAFQPPRPEDRVVAEFDIRVGTPMAPPAEVVAALQRLQALAPGTVQARYNPFTGGVRLLTSVRAPLTAPASGSPAQVAQAFLQANADVFGLSPSDLQTLMKVAEYRGSTESVTHLEFDQVIGGVGVYAADVRIHVNTRGEVVLAASSAVPLGPLPIPALSASQAVVQAAADIRPELTFTPQVKSGPSGADQFTVFHAGPFAKDVTARLVIVPVNNGLRIAWETFVEPAGFPQGYITLVDATDGRLLIRENTYKYADGVGNVMQSAATLLRDPRMPDEHPYGSGSGTPHYGCPPINNFNNRTLNTQYRDPATVLYDTGRLAGNNVHVWRVTTGSEGAQGTKDAANLWHFDFTFNTASAAETQLFFESNFVHDFFYDLGFDEASRNFQEDNFGRGGSGSDSLNANARASGRNNANFSTPPDGQNPTMNMFLWDGSGCWSEDVDGDGTQDLDGTIDSDIVIHEYHHGVTFRLNLDWGGNEGGAMGEGGGDFYAYSVNGDSLLAEYSAPSNGIRRVNAKTYGAFTCPFGFCGLNVHSNGEIWANVLWDIRERYRGDLVGGIEANAIREINQTYLNGIKLSPARPTMLEMRDAMLQDDLNRNPDATAPGGSANYCRLWEGFAGRGMGINARDTKDNGSTSVTENFEKPAACNTPPPAAPSNLIATPISSSQIDLVWVDNSNNEQGFKIERCQNAGCTNFAQIAQVGANVVTYSNTSLAACTTYRYRVRAFNGGGDSGYSNVADATTLTGDAPAAPTNLVANAVSSSQINLSWSDVAGESGYRIQRCTGSGCSDFAQIAEVGSNTTTYNDTGRSASTTYRYRVLAFNNCGLESGFSNEAEDTTAPAAPSGLSATPISPTQIDLAWTDNAIDEAGQDVERCQGASCTNFAKIADVGANAQAYSDTTAAAGQTYRYRVRATNGNGNSDYSNIAQATTPGPPAAPSNLTATPGRSGGSAFVDLSWMDNSGNEDNFVIQRCAGAGCTTFSDHATVASNATSYRDTNNVSRRADYRYRVRAVNGNGDSPYSNIASARTK